MTFIICLSFRDRHMEAARLRKENQIYSADEKWVNVPMDCFVSIASVGFFFFFFIPAIDHLVNLLLLV